MLIGAVQHHPCPVVVPPGAICTDKVRVSNYFVTATCKLLQVLQEPYVSVWFDVD